MKTSRPRVFVTGMGALLATGDSVDSLWQKAITGTSGITPYQSDVHSSSFLQYYGHVNRESYADVRKTIPVKLRRLCSETTVFGVAAAQQALLQAGLNPLTDRPERCGLFTADQCHSYPDIHCFSEALALSYENQTLDLSRFTHELMKNRTVPFIFLKGLRNNLHSVISSLFQCKGDSGSFGLDESASIAALRSALFSLRHNYCDQALVTASVSYDEASTLCQFHADGYLSQSEHGVRAFRPYDRDRNGMLLGEGAVALVLENERSVNQRGAVPLGEMLAVSTQSTSHNTYSNPYSGCLADVLRDSQTDLYDIGVLSTNGKALQRNDLYDLRSMEKTLAPLVDRIKVTCSSPLTGILGSVNTMVDVVLSLLMLKHGLVPPIAHLENSEPTALCLCKDQAVNHTGKHALVFNTGLAGFHSVVLMGSV